jgi:hypothetical protein
MSAVPLSEIYPDPRPHLHIVHPSDETETSNVIPFRRSTIQPESSQEGLIRITDTNRVIDLGIAAQALKAAERQLTETTPSPDYLARREELKKIYNLDNEAAFLKKHPEIPKQYKKQYVFDQARNMVAEHALDVPFNTFHLILSPEGKLEMYGIEVLTVYEETAKKAGPGSREWAEYEAYKTMCAHISDGNGTAQVSPAIHADRLFIFQKEHLGVVPELKRVAVRENVFRHRDTPGNLKESTRLLHGLQRLAGEPLTINSSIQNRLDIVKEPVPLPTTVTREDVMTIMNITQEDINTSNEMLFYLEELGMPFIMQHCNNMLRLADLSGETDEASQTEYRELSQQTQLNLEMFFIIGSHIRRAFQRDPNQRLQQLVDISDNLQKFTKKDLDAKDQMAKMAYFNANSENLKILGGSDCQTSTSTLLKDVVKDFIEGKKPIETGLPSLLDEVKKEKDEAGKSEKKGYKCVKCPSCDHIVDAIKVNGKLKCPRSECKEYVGKGH